MSLLVKLTRRSVQGLVRLACFLALIGLAIMSFAIISGRPLPVIFAMSVGHLVGATSIGCFVLAVLIDAIGRDRAAKQAAARPEPLATPRE